MLLMAVATWAQTSLKEIDLEKGPYPVGFRNYITSDSTRTYKRIYNWDHKSMPRPLSVSLWYPSQMGPIPDTPLSVLDYLEILKAEEEWEYLPNDQILNWFYYANTTANQAHLPEESWAYPGLKFPEGSYPVIIYAPSYQASSIENFALCEYLASHGYIVISSPSRGTETRWFSGNAAMDMETQARDVEFLIGEVLKYPMADGTSIASMGFSFGGLANIIAQNRNDRIRAVVSLDGTERYQYGILSASPFFDPKQLDVPYLHMAQKDIPGQVLLEDNLDPQLNTEFKLYDSISHSRAYRLKFHDLTHSYFSTLGLLFEKRDPRQDKSDAEIMYSYREVCKYALNFLNAYLKEDRTAEDFLLKEPPSDPQGSEILGVQSKEPEDVVVDFRDFNEAAAEKGYTELRECYESMKQSHPYLELPEGSLNNLGLQLLFNPETTAEGIRILEFATSLYPTSANLFDSLGEAYLFAGQKGKAVASFQKSLDLNPGNGNAVKRLGELKK